MRSDWKECALCDITSYIAKGVTPKYTEEENENTVRVLNQKCNRNFSISYKESRLHDNSYREIPKAKFLQEGDVLINSTGEGTAGRVAQIWDIPSPTTIDGHMILLRPNPDVDRAYFGYAIKRRQREIESFAEGSTGQTEINRQQLQNKIVLQLPPLETQRKIASVLSSLDDKIELNDRINANLEAQAKAIFRKRFLHVSKGKGRIGDYITPRRGRMLLSKDAIPGGVPVIAGGLEPAIYHSVANTVPPAVTISGSGANAGFVSLWNIPVWSSDSSFIDSGMTDNVYFWYVLLKERQREIYDAQTGSAQPHVYPKTISELPLNDKITKGEISAFTECVTPMFEKIGQNKSESLRLSSLRDALLPRLLSGELDVSELNI